MDPIILDEIPLSVTFNQLSQAARVKEDSQQAKKLKGLLLEARQIARPKAMYTVASIDDKNEAEVVLDQKTFHSRVLRVNLDPIHRAFPYIATAGQELEEWQATQEDMLMQYYAGMINEMALEKARQELKDHLEKTFQVEDTSYMSPGSLEDWPISEQRILFNLLGDPYKSIGVKLLPSLMMRPSQTVSGIRFASEETFQSCQLCPMENCPHRKAPYDEELYEEQFS